METKVESRIKSKLREMTYQAPTWAKFNNEHRLLLVEQLAVLLGYEADKEERGDELDFWFGGKDYDVQVSSIPELDRTIVSFHPVNKTPTGYGTTDRMTELIPTIRLKTSGLIPNRRLGDYIGSQS
jgi:hypothetical protein